LGAVRPNMKSATQARRLEPRAWGGGVLCAALLLLSFDPQVSARVRTETGLSSPHDDHPAVPVAGLLRRALRESDHAWSEEAFESAAKAIAEVTLRYDFSPALVLSVIQHESGFRLDAVSPRGAVGLTQILPATAFETAAALGFEPLSQERLFDPGTNIRLGFSYLASLQHEYGSLDAALRVYRAGPDAAKARTTRNPVSGAYLKRIRETERTIAGWMKTP
jgi:soluble lytic murein transglycosylase-like protein